MAPARTAAWIVAVLSCACDATESPKDAAVEVATVPVDPDNCVAPAQASNEQGVGGYCTPGGAQCGAGAECTADIGPAFTHDWFCTIACTSTTDCGVNAACGALAGETICLPVGCPPMTDAGAD